MKSFITFEEKSLSTISDSDLMELYISLGINGLETALHEKLMDMARYKTIFKSAFKNKMRLNFHTPDFIDPYNFDLMYFKENSSFKKITADYFDSILDILYACDDKYEPIITFHGSTINNDDHESAKEMTERYCDFALELIEQRRLPFILALESLNSTKKSVFGGNRQEIVDMTSKFDSPRLQICWDIVHDLLGTPSDYQLPNESFLNKVVNVHIHGFSSHGDDMLEHTPLHKSILEYDSMLNILVRSGYQGPLTNELLWFGSKDYLEDLKSDSKLIMQMISKSKIQQK